MAKTLISSQSFIGTPLPSLPRHHLPHRTRLVATKVLVSLHEIPPIHSISRNIDFAGIVTRAEGLLYTLADAAVAADPAVAADTAASTTDAAVQKSGGWFGFISEAMEFVLKVNFSYSCFVVVNFIYIRILLHLLRLSEFCDASRAEHELRNSSNLFSRDRVACFRCS